MKKFYQPFFVFKILGKSEDWTSSTTIFDAEEKALNEAKRMAEEFVSEFEDKNDVEITQTDIVILTFIVEKS